MADIVERIIFDDSKAVTGLINIKNAIAATVKEMEALTEVTKKLVGAIEDNVVDANAQVAESTKKAADAEKKALADKIKAQEVYGLSIRKITEGLKEYRSNLIGVFQTLRSTIAITEDQKQSAENLGAIFSYLGKSIFEALSNPIQTLKSLGSTLADLGAAGVQSVKNLGSSIVTAFSNPVETIKNFGTGVLNLGKSLINLTNGFKLVAVGANIMKVAIASTGIGLLVVALGSLVAFFTRTQKGADFLSQKFAGLRTAVGVLIDAFSTVGETIFNAFENPKQAIKDFGKAILDNVINRFKAVPDFIGAIGRGFVALFKGDKEALEQATKDAKTAFIQFGTGLDSEQQDKATEAIKKTVDAMKEANSEGEKLEKRKQELADAQIRLTKEEAEGRAAIAQNKKDAEDTTKSYAQRIIAAQKAIGAEQSLLQKKLNLAQKNVDIIKDEQAITKNMRKDNEALVQAEAEVSNLKAESLEKQIELNNKINGLYKEVSDNLNQSKDALFEIAKAFALIDEREEFKIVQDKEIEQLNKLKKSFTDVIALIQATTEKEDREALAKSLGVTDLNEEIGRLETQAELIDKALTIVGNKKFFDPIVADISRASKGITIPPIKLTLRPEVEDLSFKEEVDRFLADVEDAGDLFNKAINETFGYKTGEQILGGVAAAQEFVAQWGNLLNQATDIQLSNIDKQLDKLSERRSKLEEDLSNEQELYELGLANNYEAKKSEVDLLVAEEDRLNQEKEKIQAAAQKRQFALETAQQTQGLITSAIQIYKGFSAIPIVGPGLAVAAIAAMFAFFAKTRVDAAKATKLYSGADKIDDYFGVPNQYGKTDRGTGKGYRLWDEQLQEPTNVIISAREMLIPENVASRQKTFFDNLKAGMYEGMDLAKFIHESKYQGGSTSIVNNNNVTNVSVKKKVRQFVPFMGKDGKQRAILKTITEDMADGTVIEFDY